MTQLPKNDFSSTEYADAPHKGAAPEMDRRAAIRALSNAALTAPVIAVLLTPSEGRAFTGGGSLGGPGGMGPDF